ncbi:MAG TPA: hypothetical protein VFP68_02435, partial [Burkholderiaceae bacterium]|nr:hypothetical protein [Burkholderiaceae bacterium]
MSALYEAAGGRQRQLTLSAAVCSAGCAAGGLALALHHPLSPVVAAALFLVVAAMAFKHPRAWLVALPALLPLIDLAPWSGWFVFEEVDLLVLALA